MSDYTHNTLTNANFEVEFGDIGVVGFSEVSGFEIAVDVIEYREGDHPTTPYKLPGLIKYSNVTLKRGTTDNLDVYTWIKDWVETGSADGLRQEITIYAKDASGLTIATWVLTNAFPVKYSGPDFNATGSEVAFENIELAHEGIKRS